jgi:hypothetical protein
LLQLWYLLDLLLQTRMLLLLLLQMRMLLLLLLLQTRLLLQYAANRDVAWQILSRLASSRCLPLIGACLKLHRTRAGKIDNVLVSQVKSQVTLDACSLALTALW